MSVDPFVGVIIGLVVWVGIGLLGGWFAGLFDKPAPKPPPQVAAK